MSEPVVTCHVNETLHDAVHRMIERDCGALAVVNDEGRLTGMITDRDVCMAAYSHGERLNALLVNTAMTKHVVAARPDQKISEVAELMARHRVHRIPVIDTIGRPIGMVSLDDLAIESVQPDTVLRQEPSRIAYTLAAICQRTLEHRKESHS